MTVTLMFLAALTLGALFPARRLLIAPALIGGLGLVALAVNGRQVGDTPIPFLIVITTAAMLVGGWSRSQVLPVAPNRRRGR